MPASLFVFLFAGSPAVLAQSCDASALEASIAEASPHGIADLYVELAQCDPARAGSIAPEVFEKVLSGDSGDKAAIAAIEAGAGQVVREWVTRQISDERARTIVHLGDACNGSSAVVDFFVQSCETLGDRFWSERWQRGLADCHEPAIQELLRDALQVPANQNDPSRFGSIVEAYSRNAGADAISWLKALATSTSEENQLHVISAFADASGVGSVSGTDEETAREAAAAILDLAPQLPTTVQEQARIILQSMGDQQSADQLAGIRYASARQPSGDFLWGAVAVETATCKNGKVQVGIHWAPVYEAGTHWPDQMQDVTDSLARSTWTMNLGSKCKGTSTYEVIVPPEPFVDEAAWIAWRDSQLTEIRKRDANKTTETEEPPLRVQ